MGHMYTLFILRTSLYNVRVGLSKLRLIVIWGYKFLTCGNYISLLLHGLMYKIVFLRLKWSWLQLCFSCLCTVLFLFWSSAPAHTVWLWSSVSRLKRDPTPMRCLGQSLRSSIIPATTLALMTMTSLSWSSPHRLLSTTSFCQCAWQPQTALSMTAWTPGSPVGATSDLEVGHTATGAHLLLVLSQIHKCISVSDKTFL